MPPSKWNDKMERDMLVAVLMAMRGGENEVLTVPQETCKRAAKIMGVMGYIGTSGGAISQRWTKTMQKDFLEQYGEALKRAAHAGTAGAGTTGAGTTGAGTTGAGTTSAAPASDSPTQAPARRGNRTQKRKPEQAEISDIGEGDEADAKKAPAAKKQKKN
ncbi:hypothetical protein GGR51DRAFT_301501 [Nemania sp. FL0031]|nr:hypothetical protein GGR51DRAFT_301501 [Nemania sp. FL0031]